MKIRDFKIKTQLLAGNSLVVIMILFLAVMAYLQSKTIIGNMTDLYNHPYHVGRATRDINTNCAMIHSYMKNIVFEEDLTDEEILDFDYKIEVLEKHTYDLFDLIYGRYLGQKNHIDSAYNAFVDWKVLRDKLIFMKQHDKRPGILPLYRQVNQPYVDDLLRSIKVMVEFEGNKSLTFYTNATHENSTIVKQMLILVFIIIALILLINYSLLRQIYEPLKGLTAAADQYRTGNYHSDYVYESRNEFGVLSNAFQKMASTFRKEITLRENTAEIGFTLHDNDLMLFIRNLLSKLISYTGCQVAAFYILEPEQKLFRHFYSIGMDAENFRTFSSEHPEGEFGMMISEKKIQVIRNIPDDTSFLFATVTGTFRPREIVSVPILNNRNISSVISLSSVSGFDPLSIQWLNDVWPVLTSRINGVIASQKIRDYSVLLDNQNKELGLKNKELSHQTDELREYNLELNVQKKQLDQMNYLKTTFLSNMSHELRTPLNSVIALASVLTRKLKDKIPEDEYNYVKIIEKNGKELLALINDILDLSRIEAGKEVLTISSFSVQELVSSIINNLTPQIHNKDLKIISRVSSEFPPLVSDRVKCNHILQNIIHNAIKFTEKGKVEIDAAARNNDIVISISDTGIGIEPDKLDVIFDEFRQADEISSRRFGGTGLGLAIAKKYCQMLGGGINVQSTPGSGSVFTIQLPIQPLHYSEYFEDKDVVIKVPENISGNIPETSPKVMIIEDSEAAIIQVSDILQEAGYRIAIARNGNEAIGLISESVPDAIILDLMMPATDGFEILTRIRNMKACATVPVLILTAKHLTAEEISSLKRNNISQLIQKGAIGKEELLSSIKKMLIGKSESRPATGVKKLKKGKPSILIIEDNPDNMLGLKAILQEKYTIYEATDGIEGVGKAKTILPDLILLDISLPGMDGFAVLDELRGNADTVMIPVIALTARALNEDRDRFIKYGFDGFIPKPVETNKLEETIVKFLRNTANDPDPRN